MVVTSTMTLKKGAKLTLKKVRPSLLEARVAITWQKPDSKAQSVDVDLSALMLDENNRIVTEQDFIFYHQPISPEASVHYLGDNQEGSNEGDDGDSEAINVRLQKVPVRIARILFAVTINEAAERRLNFGKAKNLVARLFDNVSGEEIARWPMQEDYNNYSAMLMCDLIRNEAGWDYTPIGQGSHGDLESICRDHGLVFAS